MRAAVGTTTGSLDASALRRRIGELGPWYQNIDLGGGIHTKDAPGSTDIFSGHDIPRPLWSMIMRDLGDISGARVLDVGCNAGFMSFEAKRLGAASVLGVDNDFGATTSFISQAELCREVLGLEVEFRNTSFFDLEPDPRFDLILFCGVLYHLEDFAGGLDKLLDLAVARRTDRARDGVRAPTQSTYGIWIPRRQRRHFSYRRCAVLLALVEERGFHVEVARDLGTRALLFLRTPGRGRAS